MTRAAGCYFEPGKRCNKNSGDLMQHILLKSDYDLREPPLLHGNFWLQVVSRKVKNKFLNHLMIADTHQHRPRYFFIFEANNRPLQLVIHVVQRPYWRARDALRRRLPCEQTHLYELYSARGKSYTICFPRVLSAPGSRTRTSLWACSLARTRKTKEIIILSDAF